ncbi:Asp-tRNA(Asn)/Glu-tRNA(Gln) amidotransferase GatCAB subunit A [Massilibacterium senegalense]|uniref:Asp-tRNA(Asn)/Glu-tRNA(Gln) amidotransferase GatCAB subunit A n=1 Tax=Massilibacterium senegalense TaxID=1632858 RepID=UPI000786090A|nr:Asp-tRNA(Asn)/Glu-tRNA(Gln) amidotransferase GatCAB subunit A [Massilibacterium senegalense]
MDIISLEQQIKQKIVSPTELVHFFLKEIEKKNGELNAFITVCEKEALQSAEQATIDIMKGNIRGPLHGIPIAIKDMILTKNIRTTLGSKVYEHYIPNEDATVVRKLKDAGAIIIGKTNTHEFAYGPVGDQSYFGPAHNPYDTTKITGGSSAGSGAAVASNLCAAALGTDTGGSVRIPASACGIVGMKPTYGRVSKHGAFPLSYTLDHVGPMTKTVRDNAVLLNILAGYDPLDDASVAFTEEDFTRCMGKSIRHKKIGVPSFYFKGIDEEVRQQVHHVIQLYEQLGAEVVPIELDFIDDIIRMQSIIIQSEAYAIHEDNLKKYAEDIQREVRKRLEDSKQIKGYEYVLAKRNQKKWIETFNKVFQEVDVLLTPTLPIVPTDIFQREVMIQGKSQAVIPTLLRQTSPTNYLGNPSLSVPCGFSKDSLPIGFQLIAEHGAETKLYQFAAMFEQAFSISSHEQNSGT